MFIARCGSPEQLKGLVENVEQGHLTVAVHQKDATAHWVALGANGLQTYLRMGNQRILALT